MAILKHRFILGVAAALLLGCSIPAAGGENRLEYQVKAAFLYNFLKFVDWPDASGDAPWVVGVVGRDPFGNYLEEAVRAKKVNGREVVVRRFARLAEVRDCHVLFIPNTEFRRVGVAAQPGLLTVGESPGFLDAGGVINFFIEDERVRFEIRPEAARGSGLHISAQLLKLGSVR